MSKRKHFSKALTILLAVVMVFTMMLAMAWADEGGVEFRLKPDKAKHQHPLQYNMKDCRCWMERLSPNKVINSTLRHMTKTDRKHL